MACEIVGGSCCCKTVEVHTPQSSVVEIGQMQFGVTVTSGIIGGGGVPYTGPYEANPHFYEQAFPTAQKTMRHDFQVHAINYTEAPNDYGTTVTIGG